MKLIRQWLSVLRRYPRTTVLVALGGLLLGFVLSSIPMHLIHRHDNFANFQPTHILILMGDPSGTRARLAVDIQQQFDGGVPILLPEENPSEFVRAGILLPSHHAHREYLVAKGVDRNLIQPVENCANTSTLEEARCLQRSFNAAKVEPRILIVTSWFHTSRAAWLFTRVFSEDQVRVAGTDLPEHSWWTKEDSMLNVFNEWLKWTYWRARFLFSAS